MAKYLLSPEASQDLVEIFEYTVQVWSVVQANKYVAQLRAHCQLIADNPRLGKREEWLPVRYLCRRVKKHVVLYRFDENGLVVIIRILHEAMDLRFRARV